MHRFGEADGDALGSSEVPLPLPRARARMQPRRSALVACCGCTGRCERVRRPLARSAVADRRRREHRALSTPDATTHTWQNNAPPHTCRAGAHRSWNAQRAACSAENATRSVHRAARNAQHKSRSMQRTCLCTVHRPAQDSSSDADEPPCAAEADQKPAASLRLYQLTLATAAGATDKARRATLWETRAPRRNGA